MTSLKKIFQQPAGTLWRTALVRLPRAVPDVVLHYTSPEGPQPFVINLSSRGSYRIPVYVFLPESAVRGLPMPVVLDYHGGGFYLGSCLEQAPFCAQMARELGAIVMSVDYRMGPLDKFPAAIEDAEDVLWAIMDPKKPGYKELRVEITSKLIGLMTQKNPKARPIIGQADTETGSNIKIDTHRIAFSGFSSGGNLALNIALSVRAGHPLVSSDWPSVLRPTHPYPIPLLLFYPSFDARQLPSERTLPLGMPVTKSFWEDVSEALVPTYLPRDQATHPRASPGLADIKDGGLHQQARMLLVLPEMDNLAQQSEMWVEKVAEEGRSDDLRVLRYKGMKHGWTQMPESWLTEEEKRTRKESFEVARDFVKQTWATVTKA